MARILSSRFDEHGRHILEYDDDDDGGGGPRIVSHGQAVRVPLLLMDHAPVMDARESAWLKMCDRLRDAWRQGKDQKGICNIDTPSDPLPLVADAMAVKTSRPAAPLIPPRAQVATTFETCPSCQYLSPSGPVKICQSCGYRASVLATAPAAAYARYRHV